MTTPENPYLPPRSRDRLDKIDTIEDIPLWRKDRLLVMDKEATLPDRCVKSNVPSTRRLKRSLSWHPQWIFVLLLISPLIYVLVALIIRKTAKIHIGLSEQWFAKRRRAILVAWLLVALGVAAIVCGIAFLDQNDKVVYLIPAGIVLFLSALIYAAVAVPMVTPKRIDATHVWLRGVCPEFLEDLPEWPDSP